MSCVENCCSRIQTIVADVYNICATAISSLAKRIYAIAMSCLKTVFCCSNSSVNPTPNTFADVQNEELQTLTDLKAILTHVGERRIRVSEILADLNYDRDYAENELRAIRAVERNAERELERSKNRISEAIARLIPVAVDSRGNRIVFDSLYQPEVTERIRHAAVPLMPADIEVLWSAHIEKVNLLNRDEPLPEFQPALSAYLDFRVKELEVEFGIRV